MAGCLILIQCQHPPSSGAAPPTPTQIYTLSLQAVLVEYHIGESERVCEFILVESVAPQTTQMYTLALFSKYVLYRNRISNWRK